MNRLGDEILKVLQAYLSTITAKAILSLSALKARVILSQLNPRQGRRLLQELEKGVRLYIPEAQAQSECIQRLAQLLASREMGAAQPSSLTVPIQDEPDIVRARMAGRSLCMSLGFSPSAQIKIATVISELARNIVQYASPGVLEMAVLPSEPLGIEVVARDGGKGITDLELILSGGYRSRTGMGMGLLGTQRLMDEFDIRTSEEGTTVRVRKFLG